jgi:hypothetical protein
MLQAASQGRGIPLSLQDLADEPQTLERGLSVLDVGLRLGPGLVLDLVLRDSGSRPVVVLGEGNDGVEALLGRAVCAVAEVRRMRDLLERLFKQEGVSFGEDPRVILVARRFSDALLAAADLLGAWRIELVEAHEVERDGSRRLVVVRAGGATRHVASPAPDPSSRPKPAANGTAHVSARNAPLGDEAKKKILRISDDIEEEVEGGVVRFKLHDELIAVLEQGQEGAIVTIGDSPDRRRSLAQRSDLDAAIDDVVRRYFTLARQFTARPARRAEVASS